MICGVRSLSRANCSLLMKKVDKPATFPGLAEKKVIFLFCCYGAGLPIPHSPCSQPINTMM